MTEVPRLLKLAEEDNVYIAAAGLVPSDVRASDGALVGIGQAIALGHKVAARSIGKGEKVVRLGVPIGSATSDIAAGEWVHTHNIQSDYIRTVDQRGGQSDG